MDRTEEEIIDAAKATVRAYNQFWMLAASGAYNESDDARIARAEDEVHDAVEVLADSVGLVAWSDTGKESARA